MTNSQLLDRFVSRHDQAAFRALVVRHGPAVLQACRCILRDAHEAEDAFQATFVVLVQKAPSIRDPESLGNWLIGVAHRVARRARRRIARRRERERRGVEMLPVDRAQDLPRSDLRRVIREELDRLPEVYRAPIELCYLEGLTHEQAAKRLGWPVGTVKVRLVRSRRLLRDRLDRRGMALGLALLMLPPRRIAGELPEALVGSTVEAMRLAAAGRTAALGVRFASAVALAEAVLRAGSTGRWSLALLATLGLSLSATGVAVLV